MIFWLTVDVLFNPLYTIGNVKCYLQQNFCTKMYFCSFALHTFTNNILGNLKQQTKVLYLALFCCVNIHGIYLLGGSLPSHTKLTRKAEILVPEHLGPNYQCRLLIAILQSLARSDLCWPWFLIKHLSVHARSVATTR